MRRDRKTDVMTTKTVQKHLLLHGFLYRNMNYVNRNCKNKVMTTALW